MIVYISMTVHKVVDGCFRIGGYALSLMLYFHDRFTHPIVLWPGAGLIDVPVSPKDDHL